MSILLPYSLLLASVYVISAKCDTNQVLFEEDWLARQTFNRSSEIQDGLFRVQENDLNRSAYKSVRTMDRQLNVVSEPSNDALLPASTAWKFFKTILRGHDDQLWVRSVSLLLSYIYADSTGLMSTSTALFKRGNNITKFMPFDYVDNSELLEFPIRLILRRTGNGTFEFPLPGHDISNSLIFGNDTFGRTTSDCSREFFREQVNIVRFTEAMKGDCMGVVSPIEHYDTCYDMREKCLSTECTRNCCSFESDYDPKVGCALPQVDLRLMNRTNSFMDLLNRVSSWTLDPPRGTGRELQQVFIVSRNRGNRDTTNGAVNAEARNQIKSSSDAVDSLLYRMIVSAENSLTSRPNSIDLILASAGILSSLLAIDSAKIYKYFSRVISKQDEERSHSKVISAFFMLLATILASSPALLTAGVIMYQEIEWGTLDMVRYGNGWHGVVLWETPDGQKVWWIQRILAEMELSTYQSVRRLYIIMPLVFTLLDTCVEFYRVFRYRRSLFVGDELLNKEEEFS